MSLESNQQSNNKESSFGNRNVHLPPSNIEDPNFLERMYERLYDIPVVNRLVVRMAIAYNQFWLDQHEIRAVRLRNQIVCLDERIRALEQSLEDIESTTQQLEEPGILVPRSVVRRRQKLGRQIMRLKTRRDALSRKLDKRDNKKSLYTNQRDRIADRLIKQYEERLSPMEKELDKLHEQRLQLELQMVQLEIAYKKYLEQGNGSASIQRERKRIRKAIEQLHCEIAVIDKEIARIDKKANRYRDRREYFARIIAQRPLAIYAEEREKSRGLEGLEEVKSHPRKKGASPEAKKAGVGSEMGVEEVEERGGVEKREELKKLSVWLQEWNQKLSERLEILKRSGILGTEDVSKYLVNQNDFFAQVTILKGDDTIDFKDFIKVLRAYFKFRKIFSDKINQEGKGAIIDEMMQEIFEIN